MSTLIPGTGHLALFTTTGTDGETHFHARPLICWTLGDHGLAVGQCLTPDGRVTVASDEPNFSNYLTAHEWSVLSEPKRVLRP
ncbi:hypothetical protein J7E87_19930 [Streptomyces sp. ISL-1]|uniref:DUF6253 family protein n=1 Tax=Streptomyces sp. ISL-1 TaxID=2817657 RepID=UPI001BE90BE0|nr:DUF6253 family protein [Streptomyces sp. ISL-1]MBT2391640.1 hypothetical protein [Streptomyces sp. ISL-1]